MKHRRAHHHRLRQSRGYQASPLPFPYWAKITLTVGILVLVTVIGLGFAFPQWYYIGQEEAPVRSAAPNEECSQDKLNECVQDMAWEACGDTADDKNRHNPNPNWCANWRSVCANAAFYNQDKLSKADPKYTGLGSQTYCNNPHFGEVKCDCKGDVCYANNRCKQFKCSQNLVGCDSYQAPRVSLMTLDGKSPEPVALYLENLSALWASKNANLRYIGVRGPIDDRALFDEISNALDITPVSQSSSEVFTDQGVVNLKLGAISNIPVTRVHEPMFISSVRSKASVQLSKYAPKGPYAFLPIHWSQSPVSLPMVAEQKLSFAKTYGPIIEKIKERYPKMKILLCSNEKYPGTHRIAPDCPVKQLLGTAMFADILFVQDTSLSYLGGLLNSKRVVYADPTKLYKKEMPNWELLSTFMM